MKRFKLMQGPAEIFEITREEYEKQTAFDPKYCEVGKNGIRQLAVCPACDNPIQIIGLYKKLENTDRPYGKHYGRSIPLAEYNKQAYLLCPYSSKSRQMMQDSRKEELTDFEISIYNAMRQYFDLAIYILKQETGIYFGPVESRRLLKDYLAMNGYMYSWATLYNIPWMLLYFSRGKNCYQMHIKKDSFLYQYFLTRNDVVLEKWKNSDYYVVKNQSDSFLNLKYSFILHKRKVVDDEVKETIILRLYSIDKRGVPKAEYSKTLFINEYQFLNLTQHAKFRNPELLSLTEELMPELQSDH